MVAKMGVMSGFPRNEAMVVQSSEKEPKPRPFLPDPS